MRTADVRASAGAGAAPSFQNNEFHSRSQPLRYDRVQCRAGTRHRPSGMPQVPAMQRE